MKSVIVGLSNISREVEFVWEAFNNKSFRLAYFVVRRRTMGGEGCLGKRDEYL